MIDAESLSGALLLSACALAGIIIVSRQGGSPRRRLRMMMGIGAGLGGIALLVLS